MQFIDTDQSFLNRILNPLVAVMLMVGMLMLPSDMNAQQAEAEYMARLSGHSEVPAVDTKGSGEITATVDGDSLYVSGSFANLESDYDVSAGAHTKV